MDHRAETVQGCHHGYAEHHQLYPLPAAGKQNRSTSQMKNRERRVIISSALWRSSHIHTHTHTHTHSAAVEHPGCQDPDTKSVWDWRGPCFGQNLISLIYQLAYYREFHLGPADCHVWMALFRELCGNLSADCQWSNSMSITDGETYISKSSCTYVTLHITQSFCTFSFPVFLYFRDGDLFRQATVNN